MADISQYTDYDMTLKRVSDIMIEKSIGRNRNYLGMSEIGESCWRMLWYRFRNVNTEILTLKSLLAIEDGYKQEDIMADRLRLVPGVELHTIDPETKKQFAFQYFGGHFCGHCDGKIKGILEAPKTEHIWENKAVNEKKFNEFKKIISDVGEKETLEKWDETYYAQSQIYMHSAKLDRHYLTVEAPGGRDYSSCRTEYNGKVALSILAKAETILKSEKPLPRLSENRSFYKCNWCKQKEICFDNKVPAVNCRTCAFSEIIIDDKTNQGSWKCYKKDINFTGHGNSDCDKHLFLNTLIPFKTLDVDSGNQIPSWIKYGLDTGESFYNVNADAKVLKGSQNLTSKEIFDLEFFELAFPENKVKNEKLKEAQKEKEEIKKMKEVI